MAVFSEFEIWVFLAGLGIFLFGMHMMEEAIRLLSGGAFKSIIRRYTGSRPKAILSGLFSTAVLQSSSAVSLMVLAFVGAGVMNLAQAIAVMMGTKIGTTATAWIVAIFGFKFNIDAFSLPLIGIGGLGLILLAKSPKYVNISKFLVAFGFLFMGLDYMKQSVDQFAELIDPALFSGYGIVIFAFAGIIMTAIMQSSSATIAIVLTMLFGGLIEFDAAAAMVVGANVGTTVTVFMGAIGGIPTKKQAAVSQLIFTAGTAVLTLLMLPVFILIILTGFGFSDNPVIGLALFHSLFNLMGVAIFYPLIPLLAGQAEKWIPEKTMHLSRYIHKTNPEISEAGLEAFRKEITCQLNYSLDFIRNTIKPDKSRDKIQYRDLEKYHAEIFGYFTRIHLFEMKKDTAEMLDELLRASRNIMNSSLKIYELADELLVLKNEESDIYKTAYESINMRLLSVIRVGKLFQESGSEPELINTKQAVFELHTEIEENDKKFIKMCGEIMNNPSYPNVEVTFLLMLNKNITQTCRMLVYSLKALLKHEEISLNYYQKEAI
ncbi:MAG: Na/Pi symporter [Balneolaceae bacterium]